MDAWTRSVVEAAEALHEALNIHMEGPRRKTWPMPLYLAHRKVGEAISAPKPEGVDEAIERAADAIEQVMSCNDWAPDASGFREAARAALGQRPESEVEKARREFYEASLHRLRTGAVVDTESKSGSAAYGPKGDPSRFDAAMRAHDLACEAYEMAGYALLAAEQGEGE